MVPSNVAIPSGPQQHSNQLAGFAPKVSLRDAGSAAFGTALDDGLAGNILSRRGALDAALQDVERLAGAHEDAVALGAAEGEVGAHFGEADAAQKLALVVHHHHPGIAERGV